MADEKTGAEETTAGNVPEKEPPKPAAAPAPANSDSPFLGKLVTPQSPVILQSAKPISPIEKTSLKTPGGPSRPPLSTEPKQTAAVDTPAPGMPPPQPAIPPKALGSADLLHGGNVISLLEDEAKRRGELPDEASAIKRTTENPVERSIREVGLKPRPQEVQKREQEERKRKEEEREKEGLPRLRTYASDMSEEIRRRGETLATIISQERERMGRGPIGNEAEVKRETPRETSRNKLLSLGALALLGVGLVALIAALVFSPGPSHEIEHQSIVSVNDLTFVPLTPGASVESALSAERLNAELSLGEMKEVVLTDNGVPLSASETLNRLGAPSILSRNAKAIMLGIHAFDRNQPFILIVVDAYDFAFQGMLLWEQNLPRDLGSFFAPSRLSGDQIYATPPEMEFRDRVVENIDIRESDPSWRVMYAFPRRDLLLITTNESTIREVLTRIALQSDS